VNRPFSLATIVAAVFVQGCATSSAPSLTAHTAENAGINPVSAVAICAAAGGCSDNHKEVAHGQEIATEKNAPLVEGRPLTAVVVTQCSLVVAVYMTMPDGRLLRFDKRAEVEAERLVSTAYTATRSERVEVACEGMGATGYETHGPV
jgi:hypothetical protein